MPSGKAVACSHLHCWQRKQGPQENGSLQVASQSSDPEVSLSGGNIVESWPFPYFLEAGKRETEKPYPVSVILPAAMSVPAL